MDAIWCNDIMTLREQYRELLVSAQKPHYRSLCYVSHCLSLTNNPHCWLCLFIVYNCDLIFSPIKTKGSNSHTNVHPIKACLTASSQCTMELCWHRPAWRMGRREVYDSADVNDIIQILNQAAHFQPSGSSPLCGSLEILTWILAAHGGAE